MRPVREEADAYRYVFRPYLGLLEGINGIYKFKRILGRAFPSKHSVWN